MSYALYRAGFTHVVGGVQCEIVRVELNQLDDYRAAGWVDDIADIDKPKDEQESDEGDQVSQEVIDKIIPVLELLESDNPDHFTEKGNPKLDAVRSILEDETIDKKDLNAAWKLFSTKE